MTHSLRENFESFISESDQGRASEAADTAPSKLVEAHHTAVVEGAVA